MLLKDTCLIAAQILDGDFDGDLDHIASAVAARKKMMFRPNARVRLVGTRNPEIDGQIGTVVKVNAKRVTVGLGDRDPVFGYAQEFLVPVAMLELVAS